MISCYQIVSNVPCLGILKQRAFATLQITIWALEPIGHCVETIVLLFCVMDVIIYLLLNGVNHLALVYFCSLSTQFYQFYHPSHSIQTSH